MHSDAGKNISLWMATAPEDSGEPLAHDAQANVCVIGAGIAGLTTAYQLAREGRSVIVLEDGAIGGGATSRTSGHLCSALDDRFYRLEQLFGRDGAQAAAQSHAAAVDRIESIVAGEGIDCDFKRVDGYLFAPFSDPPDELEREAEAARRAGLEAAMVERPPVESYDFGPAVRFAHQGEFHVMKYLHGLAAAIRKLGGVIRPRTRVEKITDGAPANVECSHNLSVSADAVVVATNSPISSLVAIHTKQAAYRTYVVALPIPRGAVPPILMWDTPDPYHYIRVWSGSERDFLIVGGEDHKTGQAEEYAGPFQRLERWTQARFPMAEAPAYRWSGQVLEPVDSLAFIGRSPGRHNVYVATGDSGNGLTHGTLAGMIVADLIADRPNPWAALYEPSRKTLRSARAFARENLNVARQYADLVTPGEVKSPSRIARGEGAIVRNGMRKVAAYRDEHGVLHQRSALCTHLGCVVQWNGAEKSWDCPCHGSRFDKIDGHPLNGPALHPLRPAERARVKKRARRRAAHRRPARGRS